LRNRKAKGQNYAVTTYANGSWMSKNMALLGSLVFIFLCIHLGDFWYKMKFTEQLTMITYDGVGYEVKDLYAQVKTKFSQEWVVIIYLIGVVALMLHLIHGFQSAFQSLGINHKKYTPLIKLTGIAYSILITIGYASIPIYMLIRSANTY